MRNYVFIVLGLCAVLAPLGCSVDADQGQARDATQEHEVIGLERAALDRWGKGDPGGLLDAYAPEITYFDNGTRRRIDGHAAMTSYYRPLAGTVNWSQYEMIEPKVQQHGDVAVLTYRLHSVGPQANGQTETDWNSTSVYARTDGGWKMIHSHWSLTALRCAQGIV